MKNLISTIVFVLVSLVSIGQYVKPKLVNTTYVEATEIEKLVLDEVNRQRKLHGLGACVYSSKAKEMAKYQSTYLSNYGTKISHDEPTDIKDFTEFSFDERVDKFLKDKYVGECAQGGTLKNWSNKPNWNVVVSKEIVASWMNSPHHREIILDREFKFFAVSILDVTHHMDNGTDINNTAPVLVLYK